jgi:uncharacterized protein involved in exopolysaccharide biosynthesis
VRGTVERIIVAARYNKYLVLGVCLTVLALTAIYVYVWPPIYKVEATLVAERDTDAARDAFYVNWNIFRKDDSRTEIELITSAKVLKEVVEEQHLTFDDVYHPVVSQLVYFWESSWIGKHYRAVKAKIFGSEDQDIPPDQVLLGKTVADLARGITVVPIGDSTMGKLTLKGPNKKVTRIANAIIDTYLKQRGQTHIDEAERSYEILTQETSTARAELEEVGQRRVAFAEKNGLTFDFQREVQEVKYRSDLEGTIESDEARVKSLEASLQQIDAELAKEPATTTVSKTIEVNSVKEAAKMKRLEIESALIATRDRYREDSPEVQQLVADLHKLDEVIARTDESVQRAATEGLNEVRQQLLTNRNTLNIELQGARAGLASMEATDASLAHSLQDVPDKQNTLRDLDRDYAVAQEKYQLLMQKAEEAHVSIATTKAAMPSVRVVDYAPPAGGRSWPKTKLLYPAAAVFGLLLGVFAALVKQWIRGPVLGIDLVRRGLPIYSVIRIDVSEMPLVAVGGSTTEWQVKS